MTAVPAWMTGPMRDLGQSWLTDRTVAILTDPERTSSCHQEPNASKVQSSRLHVNVTSQCEHAQ